MGFRRQLVLGGRLTVGIAGIQRPEEEEVTNEQLNKVVQRKGDIEDVDEVLGAANGDAEFRGAMTGQPLNSSLGRAARKQHECVASKGV